MRLSLTICELKFFRRIYNLAFQRQEHEWNSLCSVDCNRAGNERNQRTFANIVDTYSHVLAERANVTEALALALLRLLLVVLGGVLRATMAYGRAGGDFHASVVIAVGEI